MDDLSTWLPAVLFPTPKCMQITKQKNGQSTPPIKHRNKQH